MIELLKNNRIDSPLLCELASHPDFVKLLADIKIYVEDIATMQIQNLNTWVDAARDELIKKYQPDESDSTLYLLQSAHILNFKGNRTEQLLFLFCKQAKIKYHNLTEEEKRWLIQIVQKSEFLKSHIPQRGKNSHFTIF